MKKQKIKNVVKIDKLRVLGILKAKGLRKSVLYDELLISRAGIDYRWRNGWKPFDAQWLADFLQVNLIDILQED